MILPATDTGRRRVIWTALTLLCLASGFEHQAEVLAMPHLGRLLLPFDSDTWRRLALVREWLAGGSFFDHTVPRTNAPFGGIETHWTRFVDLLLAGYAYLMPASLTLDQRLMLAATWNPLVLGLIVIAALEYAAARVKKNAGTLLCLVALALSSSIGSNYFAPGNADHHNVLCTLWCLVLALLSRAPTPRTGAGIGLLLGLMAWVSVEGLVLAAFVYLLLGVYVLVRPEAARSLTLTCLTTAAVASLALLLQQSFDALTHVSYYSLSVVHVLFLSLCATGALALQFLLPRLSTLPRRMAVCAVIGAAILFLMAAVFPEFFLGPRATTDTFISSRFLPSITEARSFHALPWPTAFPVLWFPVLAAALLVATRHAKMWRRDGGWRWTSLAALLVLTFIPPMMEIRWNYYLQPTAIMIVAALLPPFVMTARLPLLRFLPRRHRPWIAVWILLLFVSVLTRLTGREHLNRLQMCSLNQQYAMQSGQVQEKLGQKPLVLLAPSHVSGTMLYFTPYSAIAGNYDYEALGLKDLYDILAAATAEQARPLLEKRRVAALLACPSATAQERWLSRMDNEKDRPRWLEYLGTMQTPYKESDPPMLFRVRLK